MPTDPHAPGDGGGFSAAPAAPSDEHRAGRELRGGRLVLTRKLGSGGQGSTYEAVDKQLGELVAVKEFRVRGARSWKDVDLAEREARVLSTLSHPALPRHIDHFEEEGCLYLVMERIDGEPLDRTLREQDHLTQAEVLRFLREMADILDYLHGRVPPVIHRDIKPGNVLRRRDGSYVLVDFGAVRDSLKPQGGSTVVGTFGFMAPEQFQGRALPATDIYACGATALASLTGVQPEELPHQGLGIDVRAALGPTVDPALVDLLAAMLQPDPDLRPSRLKPLVDALAEPPATPGTGPAVDARDARGAGATEGEGSAVPEASDVGDVGDVNDARAFDGARWTPGAADGAGRPARQSRAASRAERRRERARAREEAHQRLLERRMERRRHRHGGPGPGHPPALLLPVALLLTLGLIIARVVVALVLQVAVPVLLTILSVLLTRRLRDAAISVRDSARRADARMDQARLALLGQHAPPPPVDMSTAEPEGREPGPSGPPRPSSSVRVRIHEDARPNARTRVSTRPGPLPTPAGRANSGVDARDHAAAAAARETPHDAPLRIDAHVGDDAPEDDAAGRRSHRVDGAPDSPRGRRRR